MNEDRLEEVYRPSVKRWVCGCPAFVRSRYMICKHLIQACKPVPAVFFREVTRNRLGPTWKHPALAPIHPEPEEESPSSPKPSSSAPTSAGAAEGLELTLVTQTPEGSNGKSGAGNSSSNDRETSEAGDDLSDDEGIIGAGEFREELEECRRNLLVALDIINYNLPLNDLRILPTLRQKLAPLKDLVHRVTEKEEAVNSQRRANPSTFNAKSASVMFFRTRPPERIRELAKRLDL